MRSPAPTIKNMGTKFTVTDRDTPGGCDRSAPPPLVAIVSPSHYPRDDSLNILQLQLLARYAVVNSSLGVGARHGGGSDSLRPKRSEAHAFEATMICWALVSSYEKTRRLD